MIDRGTSAVHGDSVQPSIPNRVSEGRSMQASANSIKPASVKCVGNPTLEDVKPGRGMFANERRCALTLRWVL